MGNCCTDGGKIIDGVERPVAENNINTTENIPDISQTVETGSDFITIQDTLIVSNSKQVVKNTVKSSKPNLRKEKDTIKKPVANLQFNTVINENKSTKSFKSDKESHKSLASMHNKKLEFEELENKSKNENLIYFNTLNTDTDINDEIDLNVNDEPFNTFESDFIEIIQKNNESRILKFINKKDYSYKELISNNYYYVKRQYNELNEIQSRSISFRLYENEEKIEKKKAVISTILNFIKNKMGIEENSTGGQRNTINSKPTRKFLLNDKQKNFARKIFVNNSENRKNVTNYLRQVKQDSPDLFELEVKDLENLYLNLQDDLNFIIDLEIGTLILLPENESVKIKDNISQLSLGTVDFGKLRSNQIRLNNQKVKDDEDLKKRPFCAFLDFNLDVNSKDLSSTREKINLILKFEKLINEEQIVFVNVKNPGETLTVQRVQRRSSSSLSLFNLFNNEKEKGKRIEFPFDRVGCFYNNSLELEKKQNEEKDFEMVKELFMLKLPKLLKIRDEVINKLNLDWITDLEEEIRTINSLDLGRETTIKKSGKGNEKIEKLNYLITIAQNENKDLVESVRLKYYLEKKNEF